MFTQVIKEADKNTVTRSIDCTKTRRAAFVLASMATTGTVLATVELEGSIDKNEWVKFGTMKIDNVTPVDGGNAEFIWPQIRCKITEITGGDALIKIFTRA